MVIKSRWGIPIDNCSLQQWIFGSSKGPLPDRKAIIDAGRPDTLFLTMEEYRLLAKRVGLGLQQAGLKPGDRVLVYSGNNVYFPSIFLGVLMAGGIFTGANPTYVAREVAYQLRDSGASFMFAAKGSFDIALQAAEEAGLAKDHVFIFDAENDVKGDKPAPGEKGRQRGARHWTELIQSDEADAANWDWVEPSDAKKTTCCLNYSSGTTGVPKGVQISHHSYVANCSQVVYVAQLDPDHETKRERARALAFLPMYHAYGQTYFVANYPRQGVPIYVMAQFDLIKMLQHIQNYRITTLACVPPIIVALAKHPASRQFDLSSVEVIGSGAAPLAYDVSAECESLFKANNVVISQGWGMTETTCTCLAWDSRKLKPGGGVGELYPNCSAKIMELDGKTEIKEAKTPGELWVNGPNMLLGYWQRPEATRETVVTDADGTRWLRTGDIGYCEKYEPGAIWHIVDRIKELIKVKGNQVAPAELEGLLLEHPAVTDVGVIGVTLDGEEYPRAYVVRTPGTNATEKEIAEWLAERVTRYKQLKGGVVFVDTIPKNPSGKILRKVLRDQAHKEVGDRKQFASRI
ncbi:4-coumarate--CoA ligase-like 7 [Cytospora mali]|uniref:4-coumarate--CoA ligase-like 7 n=1 Tax=Cytospora mali TaxID=578113 RepID=A0A194VF75_CYTMA|nr:4-coumarate--CoA ligase-like 7 [Valsa mali var. pyri (nom. inval.)]